MADPIWLLRVELGPVVWYAATDIAVPVNHLGESIPHEPTLSPPSLSIGATPGGSTTVGDFSASASFLIPESVSLLEARGWPVSRGWGQLSQWTDGDAYEAAVPVACGWIVLERFPLAGEAVDVTFTPAPLDRLSTFPPSDAVVSEANLSVSGTPFFGDTIAANTVGLLGPWVFGRCGLRVDATGVETESPGSAAPLVVQTGGGTQTALIAWHSIGATTVTVYSAPNDDYQTFVPVAGVDANNRVVNYVDVSAFAVSWTLDGAAALYVAGWSQALTSDDGEQLRGLGDVALHILRQSGAASVFDLGQWEAVAPLLNRIEVGGYLDAAVQPWEFVNNELLCLFPRCCILWGPTGWYPVVFDAEPSASELLEGIDFDLPDGERPSEVTAGGYTSSRVEYSRNPATDVYLDAFDLGTGYADSKESPSAIGRRAFGFIDTPQTYIVSTAWLWRYDSAAVVARELLDLHSEPLVAINVRLVSGARWMSLPIGSSVAVTSETLGWEARPCWVAGHAFSGLQTYLKLQARPREV